VRNLAKQQRISPPTAMHCRNRTGSSLRRSGSKKAIKNRSGQNG
jgi:hypothetical protein